MLRFPRRNDHSRWNNPEPFADAHQVLELLLKDSATGEPSYVHNCKGKEEFDWEIIESWYSQGSSGGDRSGYHYYQIDPELAERMKGEGLVEPQKILYPGYTVTEEKQLVISPKGIEQLREYRSAMREKAESLLVPGIHTDLTGEIKYRGYSRDTFGYGALYYEFEMPTGGRCSVYPEDGRIVLPDPSDSAEAA